MLEREKCNEEWRSNQAEEISRHDKEVARHNREAREMMRSKCKAEELLSGRTRRFSESRNKFLKRCDKMKKREQNLRSEITDLESHSARNWGKIAEEDKSYLATAVEDSSKSVAEALKLQFESRLALHVRQMVGKKCWDKEKDKKKKK